MRLQTLLLAALLLAACNSILGNKVPYLVSTDAGPDSGVTTCRLNSNCRTGDVCIFQTCGPPCNGDEDCATGSRCLKTDTGTACVSSSAATCAAGCPAGTTCSTADGVCRNACDATQCLTGQSCSAGLCVGTDQHESGSGGGGGMSGGGAGGNAGLGGTAPMASCQGVTCQTPPANDCISETEFKSYDTTGSCADGVCSYTSRPISCACQNHACTTDPCVSVTCNKPPAGACKTADTATTYAAKGTCSAGSCSYAPTDSGCGTNNVCAGTGVCSECKTDSSCGATCTACAGGTPKCKDLGTTSKCVACVSSADCSGVTPLCNTTTNVCSAQLSCVGLAAACGLNGNANCCASSVVPAGTFNRSNDADYPATLSDFRLDTYEITVGRFRKFWNAYPGNLPAEGSGKNPNNPSDPGWDATWNTSSLPASQAALTTNISCDGTLQTWTASNDNLPMNCIDWYEAEAFCIWDGGRLPTEAEWNYAAAGGTAQRAYPWGSTAPGANANLTIYGCYFPTGSGSCSGIINIARVGSIPAGNGLYGQADLAGSVFEWAQDWYDIPYTNPCNDCAHTTVVSDRVIRGGGWSNVASYLLSSDRGLATPSYRFNDTGARCARLR